MDPLYQGSIFEKLPFHNEGAPEPRSFRLVRAADMKGSGVDVLAPPAKRPAQLAAAVPEVYLVYANPAATGSVRKLLRGLGVGQQKAIPLSSVAWVRAGWHTPAFRRFIDAGIEIGPRDRCFSVMTSTRSLDLICGSARECADWVAGLNAAVAAVQGRPVDTEAGRLEAGDDGAERKTGSSRAVVAPSAPLEGLSEPAAAPAAAAAASSRRLSTSSRRGSGSFASPAAATAYFAQTVFPAIAEGRFDDVLLAFEDGCPIEIVDPLTSETPLLAASRVGDARIARLCLDRFAVFNPVPGGDTALHVACRHGHIEVVRVIIDTVEEGVAADIEDSTGAAPTPGALATAVASQLATVLGLATKKGELPFHLAAAGGHHDLVALLLLKCSGLVLRRDKAQRTPLHAVCASLPSRSTLADDVLAVKGASRHASALGGESSATDDPELSGSAASSDDAANLSTAVPTKSRATSIDSHEGGDGAWALRIAEAADLMASPVSSVGGRGDLMASSPMASPWAGAASPQASAGRSSRAPSLLDDSPSDVPAPLLTAAARGAAAEAALAGARAPYLETIRLLLDHGADETLDWGDNKGYTPLHYAVLHGAAGVVSELLQSAANPLVQADDPLGTGEGGPTPLDLARSLGIADILSLLDDYVGLFRPEKAAAKTIERPKRPVQTSATPATGGNGGAFVFPDTVDRGTGFSTAGTAHRQQSATVGTAGRDPRARLFLSPLGVDSPVAGSGAPAASVGAHTALADSPASDAGFFSPAAMPTGKAASTAARGAATTAAVAAGGGAGESTWGEADEGEADGGAPMTPAMAAAAQQHGMSSSHLRMCTTAFLDYLTHCLPLVAEGSLAEADALPVYGPWSTVLDYTYGAPYYFNAETSESTWEPPADLVVGWLTARVAMGGLGVPAPAPAAVVPPLAIGGATSSSSDANASAPVPVALGSSLSDTGAAVWEAPRGVVSLLSPRAKATPVAPRGMASTAKKAAAIKPDSLPMSPLAIPLALKPSAAAASASVATSSGGAAQGAAAPAPAATTTAVMPFDAPAPASPAAPSSTSVLANPAYSKYLRMARSGVPLSAVVQAMANEGIDAGVRTAFGAEVDAKRKAGQPLPVPTASPAAAGGSPDSTSGSASARVDLPAAAAAVAVASSSSGSPRGADSAAPAASAAPANPLRAAAAQPAAVAPAAVQTRQSNPHSLGAAPAPAVAAAPQPVAAAPLPAPAPAPVPAPAPAPVPVEAVSSPAPAPLPAAESKEDAPTTASESKHAEEAPAPAPAPAATGGDILADARFEPYLRMAKMGLPLRGPVAHRMAREGVPPADIEAFIAAVEAKGTGGGAVAAAPAAAPVPVPEPAAPSAADVRREALAKVAADPRFEKFSKMKKAGVPLGAIKERMGIEGLSSEDQKAFLAAHASDSTLERMGLASPPPAAAKTKLAAAAAAAEAAQEAAPTGTAAAAPGGGARPSTVKLHWDPLKLSAEQLENTVWGKLATAGGGDGEDLELLTSMFASKTSTTTGGGAGAAAGTAAGKAGAAAGGAGGAAADGGAAGGASGGAAAGGGSKTLLDFKRANNLNISLAQFRKFASYTAIFSAVYRLDSAALPREALEKLSLLAPTAEEAKALREYKGPLSALMDCDRFFIAVAAVPRFGAKVGAFCHLQSFKSAVEEVLSRATMLATACTQVMESKRLQQVLGHVLTIGNVLNQGNTRLEAQAISLDSLLKLSATRSADRKTTLLDALVILVDRKGGETLLNFGDDLQTACSARRLELSDIKGDAAKLVGATAAARREADAEANDLAKEEDAANSVSEGSSQQGSTHKPSVAVAPAAAAPSTDAAGGGRAGMLAELMRKRAEGASGSSSGSAAPAHGSDAVTVTSPTRLGMASAGSSVIAGRRPSATGGAEVATARVKLGFGGAAAGPKVPNPCTPEDRRVFVAGMSSFCASAEADLATLQARVQEAERVAGKLVGYFGEDPRSTSSSRVLGVLAEFVDGFKAAAAAFKRRQATELKRQASVSNVRVSLGASAGPK